MCIKKHQREDDSKVLRRDLSFLYATHWHDLFYIIEVSSKYSERYSSNRADTKFFTDGRTNGRTDGRTDDGRTPGSSLYPPNLSVSKLLLSNLFKLLFTIFQRQFS